MAWSIRIFYDFLGIKNENGVEHSHFLGSRENKIRKWRGAFAIFRILGSLGERWATMGAKMAQDGPRWSQDGLRMGPRWPKIAQDSPKMAPRWPRMAQASPKMVSTVHVKNENGVEHSFFLGS